MTLAGPPTCLNDRAGYESSASSPSRRRLRRMSATPILSLREALRDAARSAGRLIGAPACGRRNSACSICRASSVQASEARLIPAIVSGSEVPWALNSHSAAFRWHASAVIMSAIRPNCESDIFHTYRILANRPSAAAAPPEKTGSAAARNHPSHLNSGPCKLRLCRAGSPSQVQSCCRCYPPLRWPRLLTSGTSIAGMVTVSCPVIISRPTTAFRIFV